MNTKQVIAEFSDRWEAGEPPDIADAVTRIDESADLAQLVAIDIHFRRSRLLTTDLDHYRTHAPRLVEREEPRQQILMAEIVAGGHDRLRVGQELRQRHAEFAEEIDLLLETTLWLDPELRAGESVGGYRLERMIGSGASGAVWLARDPNLGRFVALKLLTPLVPEAFEESGLSIPEAQALASVAHPNIVVVHAAGYDETRGLVYIDSQLVAGQPLPSDPRHVEVGRSLADLVRDDDPLPPERAAPFVAALCDGLAATHACEIFHRDVKPENVVVDPSGVPRLTDFGLAKVANLWQRGSSDFTATQSLEIEGLSIAGTPAYMAPEQARGERATARTDVFGAGAVLYFALTGRMLRGQHPDAPRPDLPMLMEKARSTPVTDVREHATEMPETLAAICMRALAHDPKQRYGSAQAMADDLHAFAGHRLTVAGPRGPVESARLFFKRNARIAPLLAATSILLIASLFMLVHKMGELSRSERRATQGYDLASAVTRDSIGARTNLSSQAHEAATRIRTIRALARLEPADDWESKLADELKFASDIAYRRGRFDEALDLRRQVLLTRESLRERESASPDLRSKRATAMVLVGDLLKEITSESEAERLYRLAHEVFVAQVAAHPTNLNYADDLVHSHIRLGHIAHFTCDYTTAYELTEMAVDRARDLLARDRSRVLSYRALIIALAEHRELRRALKFDDVPDQLALERVRLVEAMTQLSPRDRDVRLLRIDVLGDLFVSEGRNGPSDGIDALVRGAIRDATALHGVESDGYSESMGRSRINARLAQYCKHQGLHEQERDLLELSIESAEYARSLSLGGPSTSRELADLLIRLARVSRRLGDEAKAVQCRERSFELKRETVGLYPTALNMRLFADELIATGRHEDLVEGLDLHERALELNRGRNVASLEALSRACRRLGRVSDAENHLTRCTELLPDCPRRTQLLETLERSQDR